MRVPAAHFFGMNVQNSVAMFYLALATTVVMLVVARNLVQSRVGRAFISIRDKPAAALACGVSVTRYKALAFFLSALFTGIAGAVRPRRGVHQPGGVRLGQVDQPLRDDRPGGMASLPGPVLGALFLTYLPTG